MRESLRRIYRNSTPAVDPAPLSGKAACNMYKKAMEWSKKHPNPVSFNRGRHRQNSKYTP